MNNTLYLFCCDFPEQRINLINFFVKNGFVMFRNYDVDEDFNKGNMFGDVSFGQKAEEKWDTKHYPSVLINPLDADILILSGNIGMSEFSVMNKNKEYNTFPVKKINSDVPFSVLLKILFEAEKLYPYWSKEDMSTQPIWVNNEWIKRSKILAKYTDL